MRISRIYLPINDSQISNEVIVDDNKAHYIRNVLRLKQNNVLQFFNGTGGQYEGTISSISKHQVILSNIQLTSQQPQASTLSSTLVQGISSSDRMDYTIQKAAELGCKRLIPVLSTFCSQKIPSHKYDKKLQHWQAVAVSACEQSGRSDLLSIEPISTLDETVKNCSEGVYLDPTAKHCLHNLPEHLQQQHTLFIGPEGGFSPEELNAFESHNYFGIQLGQRVLRTETVAPVILSALHTLYGDFK